jgi:hypothetical protein
LKKSLVMGLTSELIAAVSPAPIAWPVNGSSNPIATVIETATAFKTPPWVEPTSGLSGWLPGRYSG